MKTNNRKLFLGIGIFAAVILLLLGVYAVTAPGTNQGNKNITVSVIHGDKSQKDFSYSTDEEYLGDVLIQEELVSGEVGAYGLFITSVDNETADDAKQQWWCITKGGETVMTSADTTPIADGETYELTLMEGY